MPLSIVGVTVTVSVSGGATAKVQATTNSIPKILKGEETAIDWDLGVVDGDSQDACVPPSAIRLVQVSNGSCKITVRAQ